MTMGFLLKRYEYLYKITNRQRDHFFIKINNIDYIMNGQKININGKKHIISLYDNHLHTPHSHNLYRRRLRRNIRYPTYFLKHGYIRPKNNKFFLLIYKKINRYNNRIYDFYVKDSGILVKLNYNNIDNNDIITIPTRNGKYTFTIFNK